MRIKRLYLKAFGPFSGYELNFGDKPLLNIVYGLNEAGKSTVLRAVTDFLYGIPRQTGDSYKHAPADLRIGACLKMSTGEEFTLLRRKGNKNTLLDQESRVQEDYMLDKFLGSISRERFGTMFGMNHLSLRRGGESILEGKGALGEVLFEAASGTTGLRKLLTEMEEEARELFKPGGSKPPINAGLKKYQEVRRKVAEHSMAPQSWVELAERTEKEKARLEKLQEEIKLVRKQRSRLERLARTLPLLAQRQEYLKEMQTLAGTPLLSASFTEERITEQQRVRDAEAAEAKKLGLIKELKDKASSIVINKEILPHTGDINALQERLDTYRNYEQEIPLVAGQIRELSITAEYALRQLNPSFSTLEGAESLRISFSLAKEARVLASSLPLLQGKLMSAQEKAASCESALQEKKEEMEELGPSRNIKLLLQKLGRVRKESNLVEDLNRCREEVSSLTLQLESELPALGLWSGTPSELAGLCLPLPETVRKFEEKFRELKEEMEKTAAAIADAQERSKEMQGQLLTGEIAARFMPLEKLTEAREKRRQGWHLVRGAWLEGKRDNNEEQAFTGGEPLDVAYEFSVTEADEVSDRLRHEAKLRERKAQLHAGLEKEEEKINALQAHQETIECRSKELEEEWLSVWEGTTITPLSPAEMQSWLERCRELKEKAGKLSTTRKAGVDLSAKIGSYAGELSNTLQELGEPEARPQENLSELAERAQKVCDDEKVAAARRESIKKDCDKLQKDLEIARKTVSETKSDLDTWQLKWNHVLHEAGLAGGTGPETAIAYLDKLDEFFDKLDNLAHQKIILEKMQRYQKEFADKVFELAAKTVPELIGFPANQAAVRMQEEAKLAGAAADNKTRLEEQLKEVHADLEESRETIFEAKRRLEELCLQAGCKEIECLPEIEQKSRRLAELRNKVKEVEQQLLHGGSGLALTALEKEAQDVDADDLAGVLEEVERQLQEKEDEQARVNQQFGVTRKEYEEKKEGTSAAALEAAEEGQSVLSSMQPQVEQYMQLRLAATVLHRGLERYREENQSPVVKRAGEFFFRLTRGSFGGLRVDFDKRDEPVLLGVRTTGEIVPVTGMSDGSQDQLYLSLRLASLEKYLQNNEPLPLVLDDLLVNFDDKRSGETLKVLAEFTGKTQVLFFTHHASLVELAKETLPEEKIDVIELV